MLNLKRMREFGTSEAYLEEEIDKHPLLKNSLAASEPGYLGEFNPLPQLQKWFP